ncbi:MULTISPECIES: LamG-like jellyroll fold domain-containing protein [unclassified Fibrobacter]|uniref:LamG-like jellyroll fold domain-containing protein n=1 Tax=unclassified Fibrobacter TaxID=2634177 RepID=UPI000D6DABA2|nr:MULTISPECIES: LamG-like jellyroll fold domain-containing protein [unclassified Fibrobacter]PWJ59797.1 concanavalin A-like lectin/glucanase superfamily protein [Fibrobacter sp. UWR4]PZW63752.1 concanavalin A-like lectin/glucanase superfamily protein [Fibrobacter sp. UWR1]
MKKFLIPSVLAFGLMACSESTESVVAHDVVVPYKVGDNVSLWQHLNEDGVAEYFEEEGIMPSELATPNKEVKCENALRMDGNTVYFDEMEGIYQEGTLVDGVCGNAVSLKSGEVAPLSINMILPMEKGTVEFWFKPNSDFYDKDARTLLGNDEARVHFFVQDNKIIFQKNHADKHFYVTGDLNLNDGWNKIAGQWDGTYMSIWVNDQMVGKVAHTLGYEPSSRGYTYGNLIVIGYKSRCCMEGPGQYSSMTTSGAYDQVRISNIARYEISSDLPADSTEIESSSSEAEIVEDSVNVNSSDSRSYLLYEDFDKDSVYKVQLTQGVSGNAGSFGNGDMMVLDALDESIPQGTFQFYFKPSEKFKEMRNAALVGSDEGRLTIQKSGNQYYFFKNLPDNKIYVNGSAELKDGWNKFAGQWDGKSISLYINDSLIATKETDTAYEPSTRNLSSAPYGNAILVGYKDYCCTTGDDVYASGEFDEIIVTEDLLY